MTFFTKVHFLIIPDQRNIVGAKNKDSCKSNFKNLELLTIYSIYILESAMFFNQTDITYGNRNKFQKIMHRTPKFEIGPYYSCVVVFQGSGDPVFYSEYVIFFCVISMFCVENY